MVGDRAELELYCDGGARGNPGEAAFAVVVSRDGRVVEEIFEKIGIATNNVAEYRGVIGGLRYLRKNPAAAKIYLDSELVVRQLKGEYRVKDTKLQKHYLEARKLLGEIGLPVGFFYVPREKNKRADQLVNLALDS